MKIAIVGTGYVGLPTAVSFAEHGNDVTCIDVDENKIDLLSKGIPTIHEEGLAEALRYRLDAGNLKFTSDYEEGLNGVDAVFCTVGTPEKNDGSADMSYVFGVADKVGRTISDKIVYINKSTVPVGTAKKVAEIFNSVTSFEVSIVSNPEFMAEGRALEDVRRPSRIVVGTDSMYAREVMEELYRPYVRGGRPIRFMSPASAELTKYGANGFLATKTSFYNELASLASLVGADIEDVRKAMGDDPRIGMVNTYVGPGWGGSCFPKDSQSLVFQAAQHGFEFKTMKAADEANDLKMHEASNRLISFFNGEIKGKRIALWGLAFKKGTDDIRVSPAITILERLIKEGAIVCAYDPAALDNARKRYMNVQNVKFSKSKYAVLKDAEALVIATDWEEFTNPNVEKMKVRMKAPVIFDWRNLIEPELMKKHEFFYMSNGRPPVVPYG
jgi:UDPglucose 6-dehydrogenase